MRFGTRRILLNNRIVSVQACGNMLSKDKASCGDVSQSADNFVIFGNGVISYDQSVKYSGEGSIKCVTDDVGDYRGVGPANTPCEIGQTYTCQAKVKAPAGKGMAMRVWGGGDWTEYGNVTFEGTGDWQIVSKTVTATEAYIKFFILKGWGLAESLEFNIDECMIQNSPTLNDYCEP